MAEAKKEVKRKSKQTGGVKKAATTTKRKASQAKKTKTKKVKLVKIDEKAQAEVMTKAVEQKPELVVTARMKRLSEKAADRTKDIVRPSAEIETVASMKLTEIDSVEYTQEEYEGLLEMYDGTIKDIKEGQIVSGKILGVSRDDVIVDVGFKSERISYRRDPSGPVPRMRADFR